MARPRKLNVRRDKSGKSRGEIEQIHPETLAVRERQLRQEGIILKFEKRIGQIVSEVKTATDALSGFTLGRLLLKTRQGRDDGITQEQFDAGQSWCAIVHRHAALMGYKLNVQTPNIGIRGGRSLSEPSEETISRIRRQWSDCYDALMGESKKHGGVKLRDIVYGIVVEDWPVLNLSETDFVMLRAGLTALAKIVG